MVSEELCVIAAMTMVILSVGRRQQLLTAKHQTINPIVCMVDTFCLTLSHKEGQRPGDWASWKERCPSCPFSPDHDFWGNRK